MILNSFRKSCDSKRVGLKTGSATMISSPGLVTLKIARNTDPNPVGVKKVK